MQFSSFLASGFLYTLKIYGGPQRAIVCVGYTMSEITADISYCLTDTC